MDAFLILLFKHKKSHHTLEGTDWTPAHTIPHSLAAREDNTRGFAGLAIRCFDWDIPFYSKLIIPHSVLFSFSGGCAHLSRNGWQEHSITAMCDRWELNHWLDFSITLSGHQKCTLFLRCMALVGDNSLLHSLYCISAFSGEVEGCLLTLPIRSYILSLWLLN